MVPADDSATAVLDAVDPARPASAEELAWYVWMALDAAAREERLATHTRFLNDLVRLGCGSSLRDVDAVVERLAPIVREGLGAEVVDVCLSDARAARLLGGATPRGVLADLLRRWRRDGAHRNERLNDLLVLPLVSRGHLVGALRLRTVPSLGEVQDQLLLVLADRVGEVVDRLVVDLHRAEGDAALAAAGHRERVARELLDTLPQHLAAATRALDETSGMTVPAETASRLAAVRGAVARAYGDAEQAVAVLGLLGGPRRGLVPSLRALQRDMTATGDVSVEVRTIGRVRELGPAEAEALFRVTHTVALNAVRQGRAAVVTISVSYLPDRVSVVVRDDGAALAARPDGETGLTFALRLMRKRLEELGGGLELSHGRPHGAVLNAWVAI